SSCVFKNKIALTLFSYSPITRIFADTDIFSFNLSIKPITMKVYKTGKGIIIDRDDDLFLLKDWGWDSFVNRRNLFNQITGDLKSLTPDNSLVQIINSDCLAPIGNQEVWAAGVTYIRSRQARMEEAKDAGGGD